jgi:membrane-bound acyltransferase YfiQ involved in biofilm formation
MNTIRRLRFVTLSGAVVLTPVYLVVASSLGWPSGVTLLAGGVALLRNLTVWLIILALMGLADTYLNRPSPALSYVSRAAFPVYVLHQSVLIVVAYYIVMAGLSPVVKYVAIMLGTLAACLALYEVFRHFRATRFILGIK